ncbi:MAG: HlyD family efflux transporter periplasmic adaptor subunit [Caldilineaceae bacterium]|nr:HlyD family efflux transporter periplasmic adaptor subunit [Caldilineaceae bacterium]
MRKWLIAIILIALIAGGGYVAYESGLLTAAGLGSAATATPGSNELVAQGAPVGLVESAAIRAAAGSVVADARVVPVQSAGLSLSTGGIVKEILVGEGEEVAEGDVILRLDTAQQRVAVARAQADLQRAQARLQQAISGPRTAEIENAQAALDAATARYERLATAQLPGNIAEAEAALAASQASLAKVLEGPSEEQLIAARAELADAQAELSRRQSAYNEIRWRPDIGATSQSANLQRATIAFEAAQARLADLQSGPSQADVASASAQVRRSRAQLDALKAAMPQELVEAAANVRASQAQLDLLLAGTREEEIAAAEADVAAATAALQQALVSLSEAELRAPFTGTVAELLINVGEQGTPNTPIARLADLSTWQVETEDLTELDIVGVNERTPVTLTFDAIPDLEIAGRVKYVKPLGQDNRGDIVYVVVIEPAQQDRRLLWNMTAVAELEVN